MINESFLISDDTLNILKSEFIRIGKLSNISDEKNLTLILIDIIRTDETDENDKKNSFIKTLETDKDEINKNNQCQEYLSSSISFSLALFFLSISLFLKNEYQEKRSVKTLLIRKNFFRKLRIVKDFRS